VALVVTLMMMSILVMMVVGLAGVMRNEQAAARNLTYQVLAEQVAEVGARQGMTAVLTSTPAAGQMTATGPGWMLAGNTTRYLFSPAASAAQIKNLERIGTNSLILGLPTDLRGSIFAGWSNLSLPGQPTNRPIARYAWWVDDEGTKLNLNAVGSNNTNVFLPLLTNFPFSADWVFVTNFATGATNSTNAAQAQALRSRLQWLPTPEALKGSNFLNFTNSEVSGGTTNVLTEELYQGIQGQVTTWSSNADLTPWGTPKVNLADPAVTAAQIKAMLTANVWTNFVGLNRTLARKYGGGNVLAAQTGNAGDILMDQIVANVLSAAGRPLNITTNTNFSGPLDPFRHRNGIPSAPVGISQTPFLSEVAVSVSSRDQNTDPPQILVTIFFMVEVVNPWPTDSAAYSVEIHPRKIRFHMGLNLGFNPGPTYEPTTLPPNLAGIPFADGRGTDAGGQSGSQGVWVGPMTEFSANQASTPWPMNAPITGTFGAVPARSWRTTILSQTYTNIFPPGLNPAPANMAVDQAYVKIDKVLLKDTAANDQIVDWVTLDDFAQPGTTNVPGNYGTNYTTFFPSVLTNDLGQMNFSPSYSAAGPDFVTRPIDAVPTAVPAPGFSPANALGLAKNDPRVRFPTSAWGSTNQRQGSFPANSFPNHLLPWRRVAGAGVTPGAHNGAAFDAITTNATGISYLNPDPVPAGMTTVLDHPHFVGGYAVMPPPNGGGFRSVAQLGSIHTGLPWRTLRLQPTPAVELNTGQGPPDWILLDAFTAADPETLLPRVNVNALVTSLESSNSTNPGVPRSVTQFGAAGPPQTRPTPLLGPMGALRTSLSTTNTNALLSNGVVVSLLTNTNAVFSTNRFLQQIAASLGNALTNPNLGGSNWAAGSGWAARRTAQSNNFPRNGFALAGELLEIQGVADDGAAVGEDVVEGRLRGFLDMVTTRSDTFSVWSIGQGLVVVTNAAGNPVRTNVMGEVRKQTVFQREPVINAGVVTGYRLRTLYTRNHVVE